MKRSNMPDEASSTIAGTCINTIPLGPCLLTLSRLYTDVVGIEPRTGKSKQVKAGCIYMLRVGQVSKSLWLPKHWLAWSRTVRKQTVAGSWGPLALSHPLLLGWLVFLRIPRCDSPQAWPGLRNRIPPPEPHEEERDKDSFNCDCTCERPGRLLSRVRSFHPIKESKAGEPGSTESTTALLPRPRVCSSACPTLPPSSLLRPLGSAWDKQPLQLIPGQTRSM